MNPQSLLSEPHQWQVASIANNNRQAMFGTTKKRKKESKTYLNSRIMSPKFSHIIHKYQELGIPFGTMIILWKDVVVDETWTQLMSWNMVSNRYINMQDNKWLL